MEWLILTLLSVLANGTSIFFFKRKLTEGKFPYVGLMFASFVCAVGSYLPYFVYIMIQSPVLFSQPIGLFYFVIALMITILGFYFFMHALSSNELSVLGPLENLRPFFVVIFSIFLLSQFPTLLMFLGIILIFIGTLILNFKKNFSDFWDRLVHSKATMYVVLSAACFGLGSIFDRKTLAFIAPEKYAFFILLGICLSFGVMYFQQKKRVYEKGLFSIGIFIPGFLMAIGFITIMGALSLATPNHVVPVQMTRSLYLAFLGFVFLKEKDYVKKILAAILMLAGVFLLTQ